MKIFLYLLLFSTLSYSSDKKIKPFNVDKKSLQQIEVLNTTIFAPKKLIKAGQMTNPDNSAGLAIYFFPSMNDPTTMLRVKVIKKTSSYNLFSELDKLRDEWSESNVTLAQDLKVLYKTKPLEEINKNTIFTKGVGHIIIAHIKGKEEALALFTFVAESSEKVIILSLLSPNKEKFPAVYSDNEKTFSILNGSIK